MKYRVGMIAVALKVGRVHDVTGSSARGFAVMQIAQIEGPIVWIECTYQSGQLYPQGLEPFFNPDRLITVNARNHKEALWCMEAALRQTDTTVVAALSKPADLMESRRLQLAAEAGGSTGVCLVPDVPVSNAAETRWRCTPLATTQDSTLHRWELIKNKKGILNSWNIGWDAPSHSITVVSASGGRACVAEQRDDGFHAPVRDGRDAQERLEALLDQRSGRGRRATTRSSAG